MGPYMTPSYGKPSNPTRTFPTACANNYGLYYNTIVFVVSYFTFFKKPENLYRPLQSVFHRAI